MDTLDTLAHHVAEFLQGVQDVGDQVEVWVQRAQRWGYRIGQHDPIADCQNVVIMRVWADGRCGVSHGGSLKHAEWRRGLSRALKRATPDPVPPPTAPQARCPEPMVFDPDLPDALEQRDILRRVSAALEENTLHEAERRPGLSSVGGGVIYTARHRVVGNCDGVLASLEADLVGDVTIDDLYGDRVRMVHLPESFLNVALMGARTWRTMPRTAAVPAPKSKSMAVILHPRVLEELIRPGLVDVLSAPAGDDPPRFSESENVASPSVTLLDDPGLDGMATSRAFDDEGRPTRRTALLIRGRMTQYLRDRTSALHHSLPATGSVRRWPDRRTRHPTLSFSSLMMERGQLEFHDLVGGERRALLVHALEPNLEVDPVTTAFAATVRWGVLLQDRRQPRLLKPGAWRIQGRLLDWDGGVGVLNQPVLSREVLDTGSAILPYCRAAITTGR